jgi:hypothetical protein
MPSKTEDFIQVRIPADQWRRATKYAEEIGGVSGAYVIQRASKEIMDLIEADRRVVPPIIKIIDGLRSADVELVDASRPAQRDETPTPAEPKRGGIRVGKG